LLSRSIRTTEPAAATSGAAPVTFRADVKYVEVDAVVTGEDGQIVTDLA
jgi:hypothetical protein